MIGLLTFPPPVLVEVPCLEARARIAEVLDELLMRLLGSSVPLERPITGAFP